MTATEIVTRPVSDVAAAADGEWSVERIVGQTLKIQECMKAVMKRDEHYGVIPGTNTKPTLLKPGAEKLCLMFRLCPEYEILKADRAPGFISYTVRCTLTHIPTGAKVATGLGSCNSREKKYTRPAPKKCPKCDRETIFRSKNEGEGWYCWRKKDGCGATFPAGDKAIEGQTSGVEDPADLDNTLLKMGCKRSLVAAVLNGTAASDCFTQDLEDLEQKAAEYMPPPEALNDHPKGRTSTTVASGAAYGSAPASSAAAPATSSPNMPKARAAGPGAWPKAVNDPAADGMREMDDQYRRTVGAPARSDIEEQLQRSVDENTIEVIDRITGEVSQHTRMTKQQGKKIHAMVRDLDISDEAYRQGLKKYYAVDTSELLTKAQAADMIERLQKTAERARGVNDRHDASADAAAQPERGDEPTPAEMEPGSNG